MIHKINIKLVLILLLATFLRLYLLGSNPPSLDWDEVSLGYNAYSILETGRDEYGNSWPLSIRSFNDYKPPLYAYASIPWIWLLGLNEFSVRLTSALFGIVAVGAIYFLSKIIAADTKYAQGFGLLSAFLLAISPWHLQFSRAAFEANLAVTTSLIAVTAYLYWFKKPQTRKKYLFTAALFAGMTLYAYHAARLVLPFIFFGLAIYHYKHLWRYKYQTVVAIIIGGMLVMPLIYISFRGSLSQRFDAVSVFTNPGEFSQEKEKLDRAQLFKQETNFPVSYLYSHKLVLAHIIGRNYLEHFNLDFLFLRGDGQPRHRAYGMGLVYQAFLPVIIYGLYQTVKSKKLDKKVIFIWLFAAPAASALTADTPHAIRSLMMVVPIQWLTAIGVISIYGYYSKFKPLIKNGVFIGGIGLLGLNAFYYANLYYVVTPQAYSREWQYGYKQLVEYLQPLESNYDEIIVTTVYDQPHIYFAFYQQIDPREYQQYAEFAHSNIGKYYFRSIEIETDLALPKRLIVVEPNKTPSNVEILHQIYFTDGEVAFYIIEASQSP